MSTRPEAWLLAVALPRQKPTYKRERSYGHQRTLNPDYENQGRVKVTIMLGYFNKDPGKYTVNTGKDLDEIMRVRLQNPAIRAPSGSFLHAGPGN